MKAGHYVLTAIAWLVSAVCGYYMGKACSGQPPGDIKETRETIIDTIRYHTQKPQSETTLGTERYTLPTRFTGGGADGKPRQRNECDSTGIVPGTAGDGGDSVTVELSVIQRHYADSTYEAWVSGPVAPRLDSVRVYAPTTLVTKEVRKPPKRWHIGVTAGYGYGTKGFQPYIGVGLSYTLISF